MSNARQQGAKSRLKDNSHVKKAHRFRELVLPTVWSAHRTIDSLTLARTTSRISPARRFSFGIFFSFILCPMPCAAAGQFNAKGERAIALLTRHLWVSRCFIILPSDSWLTSALGSSRWQLTPAVQLAYMPSPSVTPRQMSSNILRYAHLPSGWGDEAELTWDDRDADLLFPLLLVYESLTETFTRSTRGAQTSAETGHLLCI